MKWCSHGTAHRKLEGGFYVCCVYVYGPFLCMCMCIHVCLRGHHKPLHYSLETRSFSKLELDWKAVVPRNSSIFSCAVLGLEVFISQCSALSGCWIRAAWMCIKFPFMWREPNIFHVLLSSLYSSSDTVELPYLAPLFFIPVFPSFNPWLNIWISTCWYFAYINFGVGHIWTWLRKKS